MKTVSTGLRFRILLFLLTSAILKAEGWGSDSAHVWLEISVVFILGFGMGYLYHGFMRRLRRPEDYWANRFLSRGDRKSAVKLVELRPDSLDLMSCVYRSGFEEAVDGAYRALLHLGARDIFRNCFSLDVETERSARALLDMKYGDAVCTEKIFKHPRMPADLVEKAAQRLVDLGCTQLLTTLLDRPKAATQTRQIDAASRILKRQPGGVKAAKKPLQKTKPNVRPLGKGPLNLLPREDVILAGHDSGFCI